MWPMEASSIRIAAAGDVHAAEAHRLRIEAAFAELDPGVDLVLLAGDLTTQGQPEEAAVLADACASLEVPVFAVLGNHDHHESKGAEVADLLRRAGVTVLEREVTVTVVNGIEVGIVGTKGFVGG